MGEFTKPRKSTAPTNAGEAGTSSVLTNAGEAGLSSVPDGGGDQDEESDDTSSCSDNDDEDDSRSRRGAGPRTLEEKLRGERAFIEDLLDEDELEDLLNKAVPREQWKAADFVEEDMIYASGVSTSGCTARVSLRCDFAQFLRREYKIDAETNVPVKSNTVHMILGRIKACQMAARVEATLYKEKELGIMREISVVRSEVRVMVRTKNQNDVSLLRGASIREITLPNIFLYRLSCTSSVNLENQPVVMVIAARNSKTSKDARLQQSYAARHLEAELCAVGDTGLWMHFILDQIRGAQELAIDGTSRAEIAELGHWAIDKMTRAYITAIPVGVVMKKAGYSGAKQDYFLGCSRVEPGDELLALIAEHIFPGVDDLVKKTVEEASYELNVVQPWRDATTVRDSWRLWTPCTSAEDTHRLCDRFAEPGFVDRHTLLKGATQGALAKRVRRMMKVIDAVRHLRRSDGEADKEAVVARLNKIAAPGIGTFSDALTVLNADTVATYSQPGKGVKGLGKREVSKLRVACAFVARSLKPEQWVTNLFPDTWKEQMKMTLADMAREDAGQLPVTKTSTKRKKTA
ncbi:unnamed protein product [Closterium sp. NIES-64]|nr:unnamed protein product [Closterium sp. NIES-64]